MITKAFLLLTLFILTPRASSQELQRVVVKVDETEREALVSAPPGAKEKAAPLVFVFHGHGGSMQQAARSFAMHAAWPEAIVVYPQGLKTPGQLTDPKGERAGWQHGPGAEGDRDLKFFDALLTKVQADWKVDERRIYATGHSNGGGFTYLLWAGRGEKFAAFAPSGSVMRQVARLKPKPAMHVAGEKDALVKYEWQALMMQAVRKLNGCDEAGQKQGELATLYPSKSGTPVVTYIHPGGHEFPREAVPQIVAFFKKHTLPAK